MTAVNNSFSASWIALVGNPNCGKTALFNLLTGMNQKVSNYPGVTVERKLGGCLLPSGEVLNILDMPGTYSLTPESLDEQIVTEQVLSWQKEGKAPSAIVSVVDATNLSRNLYLTTQLLDLGIPVILVLNMMDKVKQPIALPSDREFIEAFGVTAVVKISAIKKTGIDTLKEALQQTQIQHKIPDGDHIPYSVDSQVLAIMYPLQQLFQKKLNYSPRLALGQSLSFITRNAVTQVFESFYGTNHPEFYQEIQSLRPGIISHLNEKGYSHRTLESTSRYNWIDDTLKTISNHQPSIIEDRSFSEKVDRILTHPVAGPALFVMLLIIIFQSIFSWSTIPMDAIDYAITNLSQSVFNSMSAGILRSLIVDGIFAGVGAILIFLPQILILVFAMTILEDSGYMSRIAFMLDRFMSRIGLHGRSVLPLMSGYACAIPGIMATRTIDSWKERLLTILIVPLMSCSARIPIYVLMISALIPPITILGFISLQGFTMVLMYFLGTVTALFLAFIMSKFITTKDSSSFIMELPPYRLPLMRSVTRQVFSRGKQFITDAGKIIMAMSIVLWFLATFPMNDDSQSIETSYAGKVGHLIEPVIKPLGFDWKIGVGLITSFAAREVFVSTLATLYNVGDDEEGVVQLKESLRHDVDPVTNKPRFSPLIALSIMVFYVYAAQCMATIALVKRETNSWKWPIFMFVYMTTLAYGMSFLVYQGGKLLGFA